MRFIDIHTMRIHLPDDGNERLLYILKDFVESPRGAQFCEYSFARFFKIFDMRLAQNIFQARICYIGMQEPERKRCLTKRRRIYFLGLCFWVSFLSLIARRMRASYTFFERFEFQFLADRHDGGRVFSEMPLPLGQLERDGHIGMDRGERF